MTNSMIPYSFIPGTKAKAGEVNANFIALADKIDENKISASSDIKDIKEILETKADKTELINEYTITESETDLNDYKTKGTYIFSEIYTPNNIPKGNAGTLLVTGIEDTLIKQIWFCTEDNPEIFTRNYTNSEWSTWKSISGESKKEQSGYLIMPNSLMIQWGTMAGSVVTYPIAFSEVAAPVFSKNGWGGNYERSDTGFASQNLTGFSIGSGGLFYNLNWIAIGY